VAAGAAAGDIIVPLLLLVTTPLGDARIAMIRA
jgi:hypothetical protein